MRTRTLVVAAFIACAFAGLVARLAFVQIVKHDEYARLADNQHAKTIPLKPKRGPILDRNGQAFAVSSRAESLYALTSLVEDRDALARRLAPILGDSAREIAKRLDSPKRFVFVKRRLPPDTVEAVRNLGEPALGFVDESMRLYPNRELAAHVVGFEGVDGKGLAGSRAGVGRAPRGRGGAGPRRARRARPRDHGRAQGDQAVHGRAGRDAHPRRHAAVHRGEGDRRGVAAHALEGGARARAWIRAPARSWRWRFARRSTRTASAPPPTTSAATARVTDPFEPGSTFKVILAAAALEEGVVRPTDRFYAENGAIRVANATIHDQKKFGWLTFSEVLQNSSNVGSIKVGLSLGKERYYKYISRIRLRRPDRAWA